MKLKQFDSYSPEQLQDVNLDILRKYARSIGVAGVSKILGGKKALVQEIMKHRGEPQSEVGGFDTPEFQGMVEAINADLSARFDSKVVLSPRNGLLLPPEDFVPTSFEDCIGLPVFVRTVTLYYTGILRAVADKFLVLSRASWIPATGRWGTILQPGTEESEPIREVEPYPEAQDIYVMKDPIVEFFIWAKELPRNQR